MTGSSRKRRSRVQARAPATGTDPANIRLTTHSYDYYDPGFGFCKPAHPPKRQSASLGGLLMGDRLYDSVFEVSLGVSYAAAYIADPVTRNLYFIDTHA